jgi:hypothetical protein
VLSEADDAGMARFLQIEQEGWQAGERRCFSRPFWRVILPRLRASGHRGFGEDVLPGAAGPLSLGKRVVTDVVHPLVTP